MCMALLLCTQPKSFCTPPWSSCTPPIPWPCCFHSFAKSRESAAQWPAPSPRARQCFVLQSATACCPGTRSQTHNHQNLLGDKGDAAFHGGSLIRQISLSPASWLLSRFLAVLLALLCRFFTFGVSIFDPADDGKSSWRTPAQRKTDQSQKEWRRNTNQLATVWASSSCIIIEKKNLNGKRKTATGPITTIYCFKLIAVYRLDIDHVATNYCWNTEG